MSKIKRIGYQHSFQVTQFLYDKIYFEAELEPGDTEEQVVQELIDKCKGIAKQVGDGVNGSYVAVDYELGHSNYEFRTAPTKDYSFPDFSEAMKAKSGTFVTEAGNNNGTCNTIGITVESIKSCQQLMTLEKVYFPLIDKMKDKEKQRELWIAYDERYGQLVNIQSIKQ